MKPVLAKHKETMSPFVKDFVQAGASLRPAWLPYHLSTFPTRWPFPRGDLFHWIPLLNHFDSILETFCTIYKLHDGPQIRDFGRELLKRGENLELAGEQAEAEIESFSEDGDREVIESILSFSRMLLENCGNRSLYESSSRLNALLNTTSLSLLECTLLLAAQLAQRFQASLKRLSIPSKTANASLLANHYRLDLERINQLALPFAKTTISDEASSTLTPSVKGKEKALFSSPPVAVVTSYTNDLVFLVKNPSPANSLAAKENCTTATKLEDNWDEWANVRVTYYTKPNSKPGEPTHTHALQSSTSTLLAAPSTPTPVRRTSNLSPNGGQRANRLSSSDESPHLRSPTNHVDDSKISTLKAVEIPSSKIFSAPFHQLLEESLESLPKESQYELLTKMRVARALTSSSETRRQILVIRLLAVTNLAYIHSDSVFQEKVLKQDSDEPRRLQLTYQLAELIHPPAEGQVGVPRSFQTTALNTLTALAQHTNRFADICSALNTSVNHGVLLYVVRKAVAEMAVNDDGGFKATEEDEWRKALLSLLSQVATAPRTGAELVAAGLLPILVEVLTMRTNVAKRHNHMIVQFLDTLVYSVRDAFQTLVNADGLTAISNLIVDEVTAAMGMKTDESSSPDLVQATYRSLATDYKIPYFQQQTMKWLLKFIHHMMTSASGYGGNFDRLLRNLIDSPTLLSSLRQIISSGTWFGSLVWTNAVSILNDFINNEPTSFAVIAEAGLSRAFLEEVSGEPVNMPSSPDQGQQTEEVNSPAPPSDGDDDNEVQEEQDNDEGDSLNADPAPDSDEVHPPNVATMERLQNRSTSLAAGIMPSAEAMQIIPQTFSSLCLNTNGMRMFQASTALQRYFEIFLSPKHVAVLQNGDDIPNALGSTFDELIRHHPALKNAIINAVLDMVGRVNHLCKTKANEEKVGAKLWVVDAEGHSVIADELLDDLPSEDSMDVDMTDSPSEKKPLTQESDWSNASVTPYIMAVSSFLNGLFHNSSVRGSFIDKGGIEHLLDLAQSPSMSHDFGEIQGSNTLQQVISSLSESKPHLVMPSLVQRLQAAADVLRPFSEHTGSAAFFAPFTAVDGPRAAKELSNGSALVKALTNIDILIKALKECIQISPYSHSRAPAGFNQLNLGDLYVKLAKSLGSLLGASIKEDILLRKSTPDQWKNLKLSPSRSRGRGFTTLEQVTETPSNESEDDPIVLPPTSSAPAKKETDSPRHKNIDTLRHLFKGMPATISSFCQVLGKALVNKRHDTYQKQFHALTADALAETVIQQLRISNFDAEEDRYAYLILFLTYINNLLVEPRTEKPMQAITLVLQAFKHHGGFDVLNEMLKNFADCLCNSEFSPEKINLAEEGLHNILDLYAKLSNGKNIAEATQTAVLVARPNPDVEFFSAAQFLVEVRMSILPSVRSLWESDIIEKASSQISKDLIEVIRTIAQADFEAGAYKRADSIPVHNKTSSKKFKNHSENFTKLKSAGYSEDLVNEALFRCNNTYTLAAEYCDFHKNGRAGQRIPPPPESQQPVSETGTSRPHSQDDGSMSLDDFHDIGDLVPAEAGSSLLPNPFVQPFASELGNPAARPGTGSEGTADAARPAEKSTPAVESGHNSKRVFVDDLNEERKAIREKLIDRSLDVINAHGGVTFQISDLITSVMAKSPDPPAMRKEMGETLVNALMSFAGDDDVRPAGKKIAAYAHLLALMLQDKAFYSATLSELKDNVSSLISFIKVSPDHVSGESSPWIAQILLIVEILLCDDAQPKEGKYTLPTNENPPSGEPLLELTEPSVSDGEKVELFTAILEILPRVGKDLTLALAILRIFVILTRTRSIAQSLGEKKNIQRLFVLAKGLSGSITERLQSSLLIILRHIIEDEETVKQIMRADITAFFESPASRTNRHMHCDLASYIKALSHLVIRSPNLFVEVTSEMVKFVQWNSVTADSPLRKNLALKDVPTSSTAAAKMPEDPVQPTVQATEDLTLGDVKTSTEVIENGVAGKVKTQTEHKPPIVENPDGVIYFLLTELLNYKDVADKEVPIPTADGASGKATSSPDSDMSDATPAASEPVVEAKDIKKPRQEFKPEDHPIYIYRCLLLQCLTELLSSYNRTKIEFINYKRNAPLSVMTPSKPRSSVINYLLFDLIPIGSLEHPETTALRKKQVTCVWADSVLCALLSKTGEQIVDPSRDRDPSDGEDEPALMFVRRFVIENILKAYKEASSSTESLELKYSRMLSLADLMNHIMAGKEAAQSSVPEHTNRSVTVQSQMQLKRIMYEKGYISALTASIADIDLNFPGAKRAVKYILRPLKLLTQTAIDLSESATVALPGQADDADISSATSVSDADEREETPDLFRNSALGMFEGAGDEETSSESGDDDEEMYEDGYEDEEMEYEEEIEEDDEDNVSDEDAEMEAMGGIEGLSGDIGIEIEMSDDDEEEDDDDDDDDPSDEDDEDDNSDEDDDMDGEEDARIEVVDEHGNVHSHVEGEDEDDWESHEGEEEDYEAQVEEAEDAAHVMDHVRAGSAHLGPMIRALTEDDPQTADEMMRRLEEEGLDPAELGLENYDGMDEDEEDEEEEEDDMGDEIYGDYPGDAIHRPFGFGAWDGDVDPPVIIAGRAAHRARHGIIPPPFPFLPGGPRGEPLGEHFGGGRSYRSHRPNGAAARVSADDGVNPLLQRQNHGGPAQETARRSSTSIGGLLQAISGPGRQLLDIGLSAGRPGGLEEHTAALLHELMSSGPLPMLSRNGHAVHLHVSGSPAHMRREFQEIFGFAGYPVQSRSDFRRDVPPNEAVSFSPQSTASRWMEEARLLFGVAHPEKSGKVLNALLSVLVPPAWEAEKIEKERARKMAEEAKKRAAEEDRIAKEAKGKKEAEEKALREQQEAIERERKAAEEAEAANALNNDAEATENTDAEAETGEAMEGVESTSAPSAEAPAEVPAADRPRITTMLRGNPFDITDLGIDPEFLNELPEEIKEEVIMSAVTDRRSQAAATGAQPSEIDREFLEALPEDIRDEIVQQERLERRRREREEARRAAAASSGGGPGLIPQDMDAASIFATMSPALRQQVLMEQDEETISHLPAELAAQARALNRQHRGPTNRDTAESAARREQLRVAAPGDSRRPPRRTISEMLDKSGIATLLRLMFVLQNGSLKSILCGVLQNVSENKNNRVEVINTLLLILQDGSADMPAVERGFAQLSLRAKSQQSKDGKESKEIKTPIGTLVKRSSTGLAATGTPSSSIAHGNTEISPLIVIQQCLSVLAYLTQVNLHVASFFLTEHESSGGLKRSLSRKGRSKDAKASKYALNSLLSLLDRNIIMESSTIMEALSDLLSRITTPLQAIDRKQKEAAEEVKKAEEALAAAEALSVATTEPSESVAAPNATSPSDTQMEEPTKPDSPLPELLEPTAAGCEPEESPSTSPIVSADEKEKKIAAAKEARDQAVKKARTLTPPFVPDSNLKLVINIFVARECSSKTFRETLTTIKNLVQLPGAKEAFGRELISKAQALGEIILVDLGDLLPQIQKASTSTEIQGVALAKFSHSSSDQNKLLRVLTALDHVFDPKTNPRRDESREEDQTTTEKHDLLASLYENSTFGPMWDKLSACLAAIRQREHMLNVATILLPLIESLMVVCKNTTLKDAPVTQVTQEMRLTSPPPDSRMESLFFTFTEEHRKILNDLVRHTPKLMIGTFSLLVKNPKVLEFDNKRNYFTRSIHNRSQQTRVSFAPLQLSVRRDNVFHDSYKSLAYKSPDEMKYGKLSIRFHGEEGVDAGGVTREWFQVLSKQMFDADYALFVPVSSDRTTFHPNLLSGINQEHLSFFKFIGRVIGKALFEGRVLDCHFSRAVYKRILGKSVSVKDMESLDPEYYKSLVWMLSNDITDIITETFSVEKDKFGLVETMDLIESGHTIPVTEENKEEYVKLVVEHKLQKSVQQQLDHFLTGFHEIIPAQLVSIFNENELELLISGLPDIDVDDWKSNTEYHNYTAASPQIQWFWRAVRSYDKEERAKLLQFVTGTSKVPLNGFKELEGMNGFSRFNIHRDYGSKDRLPSSHTCFNQLDLPEYESYESLRQNLLVAITTGSEYFGFA